jgi:hypothetical protein
VFASIVILWRFVRYRFVSIPLAAFGANFLLPAKLTALGFGVYFLLSHAPAKGVLSLLWAPWLPMLPLTSVVGWLGLISAPVEVGTLQGKFMHSLGFGELWESGRAAKREAFLRALPESLPRDVEEAVDSIRNASESAEDAATQYWRSQRDEQD